jgi:chromosome segregation ATPase
MSTNLEDDDVLARLESRLEGVTSVIARLKERNAELENRLRDSSSARDAAEAEAKALRQDNSRLQEELDSLRARQREAASRIKGLLSQVEQMDLLSEG